jgi:hypothetical protein
VYEERPLTSDYQVEVGQRLAEIMICVHPIFIDLRQQVRAIYR